MRDGDAVDGVSAGVMQPDVSTLTYMSADMLSYLATDEIDSPVGSRSADMWSLGVLLFQFSTGQLPFMPKTVVSADNLQPARNSLMSELLAWEVPFS